MTTCNYKDRKKSSKRGVALVIVLGLIAVLMMMAVAFAIHMRIERTGASNYRYGVQARHMIWSALANAVRDIDGHMTDGGTPILYPEWDVKGSSGGSMASVLSRGSAEYVPASLRDRVRATPAYWSFMKDGDGVVRGRYAFVVLNTSGLLDANRVGGADRSGGTNSIEIQVNHVPGVVNATEFLNKAYGDERYETLPELININRQVGDGRSFAVYSLAHAQDYFNINGVLGQKAYIAGPVAAWNEPLIKSLLAQSGVTQVDRVYRNMQFWADANSVPRNLAECSGEMVPMINEVVVSNQITVTSAQTFDWRIWVNVEVYYPFATASKDSFTVEMEMESAGGGTHPEIVPVNANLSQSINTPSRGWTVLRYRGRKTGNLSNTNAVNYTANFDVKARVKLASGEIVDEVPSPYGGVSPASFRFAGTIPFDATIVTQQWTECVDPRFNWNRGSAEGANGNMWEHSRGGKLPGPTLEQENYITRLVLGMIPGESDASREGNYDGDTKAFVGNRPFSRVGELGTVVMAPWTTLRLYDRGFPKMHNAEKPYHKVLDYFSVSSNEWSRGLVNVNTTNAAILASVFFNSPFEEHNIADPDPFSDWPTALNLAYDIVAGGPYTNLSELGKLNVVDWEAYANQPNPRSTDFARESLLRNTAGLLTTRQNLFTVILRADSFSEAMGGGASKGVMLASSRAVAEIWRDPIPDKNGNHKCLIVNFKYIND